MTILNIAETQVGRSANQSLDRGQRQYVRSFLIRATRDETEYTIVNASTLPIVGSDVHPVDTNCLCISKRATMQNLSQEGGTWLVQCDYNSQIPIITDPDPLTRDPIVSITYQQEKEALLVDLADTPVKILNSADDTFAQPIETDKSKSRFSITANYAFDSFDYDWLDSLADTYNDADWWFLTTGEGKMDGISASLKRENLTYFYEIQFTIIRDKVHPYGPTRQVLDQGFRERTGLDTNQAILDKMGIPVSTPKLLDGSGFVLDDTASPVYLDFTLYNAGDWSLIPFPS